MKLLSLLIFLFAVTVYPQQSNSIISTQESLAESVKLVPCDSKDRLEGVKKLFAQMGAKDEEITVEKFDKDKIQNVVVKLKGLSEETVVIGAHYDKTDAGCGAVDNWTGISIIAHLYKTLSQMTNERTYIFVAFDQEEKGLLGSSAMVNAIPFEARKNYCAMVNLDSFGLSLPFSLSQTTSPQMVEIAKNVGTQMDLNYANITFAGADADSTSFRRNGIPAITFSGLDNNWRNYLHSKNDKLELINMKSVYLGYRFVLTFISKLEMTACSKLKNR